MSAYFSHDYISNSDIKKFLQQIGLKREAPANLDKIFELGTLIHSSILEPHTANTNHKDYDLACRMRDTFWKDDFCRNFAMAKDFQREYEVYSTVEVGGMQFNSRCKCDGIRTGLNIILEIKGLNVDTEKAFMDALPSFDYDQGVAHYMLTKKAPMEVIVGLSKKKPERLFKKIVKMHDNFYAEGEQKLIDALKLLMEYSPDDVNLITV
jgi:hypothetical protein